MRVHITGGKGFLGKYTADVLRERYSVEISDIDTLDIMHASDTKKQILDSSPDIVCHLAGVTGANDSIAEPDRFFEINFNGTVNVLEACRHAKVKHFVLMSTLTIHGASNSEEGIDELSPVKPQHPYAASKACAEMAVAMYARHYNIKSAILRATLIAGEGQKEENAITQFIQAIRESGFVEIYGDGMHRREWLHPADLAKAVAAAIDYVVDTDDVNCETFIISSGEGISMKALAEKIIQHFDFGEIRFVPTNRQAFSLCSRPHKARSLLNWSPEINIDGIIQRLSEQK